MITYNEASQQVGKVITHSGLLVDIVHPKPEMFKIHDIAHALSNLCRFGGHTSKFYSVAQHCVECSGLVPDKYKIEALLHDASEAYLIDLPTPIKQVLPDYLDLEKRLMKVISKTFKFNYPVSSLVHKADQYMFRQEWDSLIVKVPGGIVCWGSTFAKERFLDTFYEYANK